MKLLWLVCLVGATPAFAMVEYVSESTMPDIEGIQQRQADVGWVASLLKDGCETDDPFQIGNCPDRDIDPFLVYDIPKENVLSYDPSEDRIPF